MSNHASSSPPRRKTTESYVITEFGTELPTAKRARCGVRVLRPWGTAAADLSTVVLWGRLPLAICQAAPAPPIEEEIVNSGRIGSSNTNL